MKNLKKTIFTGALLILSIVLLDIILGYCLSYFYHKAKFGIIRRQDYCLTKSDEDIIILGSSRAAHHYVPDIITDSLGLSCFNAGSDGMCVYYHYALLKSYIESGRIPKLVILDLTAQDVEVSSGATFTLEAALDRLAPYYHDVDIVDSLVNFKGWQEKLRMQSVLYRYNSKAVQIIKCNLIPSKENNGYEELTGVLPDKMNITDADCGRIDFDEEKCMYLEKIFHLANCYKIPMLAVVSPMYKISNKSWIGKIADISLRYRIPFLNLSNLVDLMDPSYFADVYHLNDSGAKAFTTILAGRILSADKTFGVLE